ncbi:undecaprenyl/decaprenyl-phosphate alpha-N-acetylglucosaminyl 1-phosphate transferase [Candidatus Microgenomates bacterium]|nr:undecaprenyl/decaprenyl-phosphate alpha-N-acetylglucosaminyl 1-phosphate transferase [Candidatus Microgenomates bacterium]
MNLFIPFVVAFVLSYLLTFPAIKLARYLSLVTDKRKRHHPAHTHTGIVPRGGGIPIYFALFFTTLFFLNINHVITGILVASGLLVVIGVIDDYSDTSPYVRFGLNILISLLVISYGLGIPYISNPFGGVIRLDSVKWTFDLLGQHHTFLIVGNVLAILWLTWTTNMVNWSKGVDGQLPGFVGITAIFLGLLATRFTAHDVSAQTVSLLSFIIAGAYLGFLPHNFYPQKIMPGYGGGGLAGFLLGILAILSFGKIGTAILILSIPMIDAIYSILRRIKNKQSPFKADWGHFHHRLLEVGWGRRRIAVFYWIISLVLGIASLFLEGIEKLIAFVMIALLLVVFIYLMNQLKDKRFN